MWYSFAVSKTSAQSDSETLLVLMATATAMTSAATGSVPQPADVEKKGSCADYGFCNLAFDSTIL